MWGGCVISPGVGSSPRVWGTAAPCNSCGRYARFIPTCVGNGTISTSARKTGAVHPHVCGERCFWIASRLGGGGSSPRVWGTVHLNSRLELFGRFIPTCVGNGHEMRYKGHSLPVHPHVCGERARARNNRGDCQGSSPRVWGTVETPCHAVVNPRFIPTCVGNGRCSALQVPMMAVHPHVCGERSQWRDQEQRNNGSSPRVWGTVKTCCPGLVARRFIPTCVGNGQPSTWARPPWPVHPHVCGERIMDKLQPGSMIGSSPRVWGTGRRPVGYRLVGRFIPTCVGNGAIAHGQGEEQPVHPHVCGERACLGGKAHGATRFIPTCVGNGSGEGKSSVVSAVHPHVCGERRPGIATHMRPGGSSPRVWGTVVLRENRHRLDRFIPTCVGNGKTGTSRSCLNAVHPHVCGERARWVFLTLTVRGSSPRVWGTGHRRQSRRFYNRFIPTCVGNGLQNKRRKIRLPVHPHVCGERNVMAGSTRACCGSSPRVWGTAAPAPFLERPNRFIPTCVGNGPAPCSWMPGQPVHPHVCGERRFTLVACSPRAGSSPRVWGTAGTCG